MSQFSFKEIRIQAIIKRAKEFAWNKLSKEEQNDLLRQAEEEQDKESAALAIKCLKEAKETFSDPNFVSRADPKVYSDKKPKK